MLCCAVLHYLEEGAGMGRGDRERRCVRTRVERIEHHMSHGEASRITTDLMLQTLAQWLLTPVHRIWAPKEASI